MADKTPGRPAGGHVPRRARREHSAEPAPAAPAPASEEAVLARKRRRRRIVGWTLSALAVVVIAAVAVAGVYLQRLSSAFDDQRNVLEMEMEDDTAYRTEEGVINMLLMGTDSRGEGENDAQYRQQTGEEGERSDTIMFVHIPADRSGIYVMSIMRDLWVDVPGYGEGRVNTALGVGGYELTVDTVEEMLDTHIHHMAVIDFDGFSDLTEALGGVYVDNPRAFSAGLHNPAFYPEGTIRLEGSNALRFVRERKAFLEGDYVRVENQQLVVKAIMDRFLSSDTLTNPQRVMDVVNGVVPYLTVDEGLDSNTVAGYAMDMRDMRSDDVHMFTLPTGEHTTTAGGAQVILQDEQMMELLRRALVEEDMAGFLEQMERHEEGLAPDAEDPDPGEELPEEGLEEELPEEGLEEELLEEEFTEEGLPEEELDEAQSEQPLTEEPVLP